MENVVAAPNKHDLYSSMQESSAGRQMLWNGEIIYDLQLRARHFRIALCPLIKGIGSRYKGMIARAPLLPRPID